LVGSVRTTVVARERERTQKPPTFHRKSNIFPENKPSTHTNETVRTNTDWTQGNESQVDTLRAGLAITQEETFRNHRDRKCRETDDTRDEDFKIRRDTIHKNSGSSSELYKMHPGEI